ncbi:hypothetical protein F7D57_13915 [Prevotella copri]|uniref:Uncharacterized protein n=1 Tax=Segatella copri TaxID=165179 RepID=A0AA90VIJ9_9BACT|nr:hypothetical protein [Segatella copri]MQO10785.1 hypothetical protein [Segatella copri]
MAKFQIYQYMFRPVMENQMGLPLEEFQAVNVQESLDKKQELLGSVLNDFACEKDEPKKYYQFDGETFKYRSFINQGDIYVMRIANNKKTKLEADFNVSELDNHPSCLVIIDNRKDRQIVAIERNAAFSKNSMVADILQNTFRLKLLSRRLTLDIAGKFHTAEFWQVRNASMELKGIEYVDFPFAYPNLPAISDLVGEYFTDLAKRTNSEPTLHLQGQNHESVNLDPEDIWVLKAIKACAASGKPILMKPKGSQVRKIGVESPVIEEIADVAVKDLSSRDLFDAKFNLIVEFLNKIKLVYE